MILRLLSVKEAPVVALFAALFIYFGLRAPSFVEAQGLLDCARQYAPYSILAVGLTLVIGTGGIDISVGSVLGFATVVLGVILSRTDWPLWGACVASLASGAAFGAFNGWAIAGLRLQPVAVTLSTMATARGLAYLIAGAGVSSIDLPERAQWLENAAYVSPAPVLLAIVIAAAAALALARTTFGRAVLATGSNEKAAHLSGINVGRTVFAVYAISGLLCGIAGIMTAGLMYTAITDAGLGYEFEAITAVLMGGTSIAGGEATVVGSICGVAVAALINRGFGLMGISDLWRMMCLGLILIASVLLDRARRYAVRKRAAGEGMV